MSAKQYDLPDIGTVTIYRRRGTKNIRLSINSDGKVRITIPMWLPYKAGVNFALQKQEWLASHITQQASLEDGQRIGKYHTLRLIPRSDISKIQSRVVDAEIRVSYPAQTSAEAIQKAAHAACQRGLRTEAERLLPQRLATIASNYGYSYSSLTIRHLKTRWGSCNSKQEITLNYYLMQIPWELIDYVLLHELVHTNHLHHGKEFWDEVSEHLGAFKERRKTLKQYQPSVLTPKSIRSVA